MEGASALLSFSTTKEPSLRESVYEKMGRHVSRGCAFVLVAASLLSPSGLGREADLPDPGYHCLATALYYEARGEPLRGQRAVMDVVVNRAWKSRKSFCEILLAQGQFQWTKHHGMRYDQMELLAEAAKQPRVLNNEIYFFHASMKPSWSAKMQCKRIGNHNFCKERP